MRRAISKAIEVIVDQAPQKHTLTSARMSGKRRIALTALNAAAGAKTVRDATILAILRPAWCVARDCLISRDDPIRTFSACNDR